MEQRAFINVFRNADWLTFTRVMRWAKAFAVVWALFLVFDVWAHSTQGITDEAGEHIGRDFINYWSGAKLAVAGRAAEAYDLKAYLALQKGYAGALSEAKIYSYPPVMMLMTLPLAFMSFFAGYVLWTGASYIATARMLAEYLGRKAGFIIALAAPAAFLNLESGQNGALTAGLLAGGLMLLDRKPFAAGILFGLLCYKPQIGLLLPLALAAGGQWRAFFAAAATVLALIAACTLSFGMEIWPLFIRQMHVQTLMMEAGESFWHRMPTAFAGVRMAGGGVALAYAAQLLSLACAVVAVFISWRSRAALPLKSAVLVIAIFLATPYAWDYDMVVLLFALLWVAGDAQKRGWLPYEKFLWLLLILMPFLMIPLAKLAGIQAGVLVIGAVLWSALRRLKISAADTPST